MVHEDPPLPGQTGSIDGVYIRTFLIADVRGYTLFTQERGDEVAAKLAAKFAEIAREIVQARGGTLLELRGDEALCVFSSTREAIRAALDLQARFVEETLGQPELPLTVGIGLDAGEAVPVEGGYRGAALNLAARLCGHARAGEILATREVTHLARRIEGATYEDRGSLSFKGISDPVVVVRVVPEGADPVERLRPYAPSQPPPPKTSRRWVVVGAIAAVLALVAIAIPLLSSDDDGDALDIETNSVARMNAVDGGLELATELGQRPGASAIGFGSLWIAQPDRGVVARLNLDDGSVVDTIRVGNSPSGLAVGEGSVWVTNAGDGTVSRINVETNEVSLTLPAGSGPTGIAVGDEVLWVADTIGNQLLRVDPASGESEKVPLAGQPSSVAFTADGVWVSVAPAGIARVDPTELSVTITQTVGSGPTAVVPAFDSIWVANQFDSTVSRLEPSTGRVQVTIAVGEGPNALAAGAGSLWVSNGLDDSISEIDPTTDTERQTLQVGGATASLLTDGDGLWLAVGASASEHQGGTLTMSSAAEAPDSLDPAVAYDSNAWTILTTTNDGLLAYKKVGGPDGASLVPDLASSLPDVSADGLTYRFPLHEGIRYSTGEPVQPEDFRRAIERALVLYPAASQLSAIRGADACTETPTTCDLSDSIVTDEEAVTFHLATPDPQLPFKLALPSTFPVPVDTPAKDQGLRALPATGPYMVAEADADGIELVRNPEFQEWAGAAQPDGFVDSISWRFEEDVAGAFDRLSADELDLMMDEPGPEDLATLRSAHPDQVVAWLRAITLFVGFDVLKPPFDDERVRQAVNYAIDRDHAVDLLGGSTIQRPACQILPPNFQGYEPFCPYTRDPQSGVWSAPDIHRARSLIGEARVTRERVTVWVTDAGAGYLPSGAVETMRYVVGVLETLGLRAELKIVHDGDEYFDAIYPPPGVPGTARHPQIYMSGWFADYPGAGDWIRPQFSCGEQGDSNQSGWCSETLDAQIDEALLLYASDPAAANRAWADIEHQLVESAAQATLTNPVTTRAVSARVGNVQVNTQWGILLSRLWVQ
jgi:peptide/nickel transport system substrate-binding protein